MVPGEPKPLGSLTGPTPAMTDIDLGPTRTRVNNLPSVDTYRPTLASTSARRKRSTTNMKAIEGTSRISAVIEAIW